MEKYIDQVKAFLYGLIIYFQMDHEVSIVLISLILLDMFLGLIKASVLPTMKVSMNTFWAGLLKKSMMLLIVMVLALVAKGLGFSDFKLMVVIVMKIMLLNEGISIFNSIRSIWQKKEFKSNDFVSILIEKIGLALTKYMDKLMRMFDDKTGCL